ncbi:hypothetical protein L9F63_022047 [Diploptera punctata]|uniref:Uncharacterized protein n=1 Tax=Diploptera punctata TaxID=6984 RepID=A0AAD8EAW9_DIPPU|nr:hypothetical protein L9F63_022047 [Diploptera punctata]
MSASLASSLSEDDLKDLEIEKDILNVRDEETKLVERHPRAVRLKLLRYFVRILKRASPKLRHRIINYIRRPKIRNRHRHVRPVKAGRVNSRTVVAKEERPGWFWTIVDTLDSFGVFDYLFGRDYDEEPETKAKKSKPPPKKTKRKHSK